MVSYTGTDDGRVVDVKIIQSSGSADLDQATVQCAGSWRFDAAVDKFDMGQHRTYVIWKIPEASAGSPPKPPQGIRIGIPHACLQDYPAAEMMAHIGGTTTVGFMITEEGHVSGPHVVESSGNADLDAAALRCVVYWQYRPAVKDGKPVSEPWMAKVVWNTNNISLPSPQFAEPPRDCLHAYVVKPEDLASGDGITEVTYTIADGDVRDARVVHSSGSEKLDRAAVECVMSRKFKPLKIAIGNGQTVTWKETVRERVKWRDALDHNK